MFSFFVVKKNSLVGSWFGNEFSLEYACVPLFVEQQVVGAGDTSDSLSLKAGNVLTWVVSISNVSTEVWSVMGAFVWAFEGGGWMPFRSGDTVIRSGVQTLVASFAEFQREWEAWLARG